MKRFLFKIVVFLFLLLGLNICLFWLGNDLYYRNYDKYSLKFNSYLLADSHGLPLGQTTQQYGIYNFSAESESYIDMKRKLNFLTNKTKIDTIFISVDEHTLSPYRELSNNLDRSLYYATYLDFNTFIEYIKEKTLSKIIFFQPKIGTLLRKYYSSKFENLFKSKKQVKIKKQSWNQINFIDREIKSKERAEDQFGYTHSSDILKKALISIIKTCEKNDIVLIGVKFPLTKEYRKIIENKSFKADSIFKANGKTVLDFKNSQYFTDKMFLNQDHLNENGGRILSNLLFKKEKR